MLAYRVNSPLGRGGTRIPRQELCLHLVLHASTHQIAQPENFRVGETVIRIQPLFATHDKPEAQQQLQVLGQIGLTETGIHHHFADVALSAAERAQNLQARGFSQRTKAVGNEQQLFTGERTWGHGR